MKVPLRSMIDMQFYRRILYRSQSSRAQMHKTNMNLHGPSLIFRIVYIYVPHSEPHCQARVTLTGRWLKTRFLNILLSTRAFTHVWYEVLKKTGLYTNHYVPSMCVLSCTPHCTGHILDVVQSWLHTSVKWRVKDTTSDEIIWTVQICPAPTCMGASLRCGQVNIGSEIGTGTMHKIPQLGATTPSGASDDTAWDFYPSKQVSSIPLEPELSSNRCWTTWWYDDCAIGIIH